MARDFYVVLGITRDAGPDEIKSAYRRLVKRYHPDASTCGQAGGHTDPPHRLDTQVEAFHQVAEAYQALTDSQSRQEHDRILAERERRQARQEGPVAQGLPIAESLFSDVDHHFGGWVPDLFEIPTSQSRKKDLFVEIVLSPAEARAGGMIPLRLPVQQQGGGLCYHHIEVSMPPGVADGTQARLPMRDIGLPSVQLTVMVTVR